MDDPLSGNAAYSLYDVLRTLVDRASWPTEEEKRVAIASVDAAERMRVLGDTAKMVTCDHPGDELDAEGRCPYCGKMIQPPVHKHGSGNRRYRYGGGPFK